MKRLLSILIILLLLSVYIFPQESKEDSVSEKVDNYVNTIMNRHKIPGAALAIIKDGKVTHKKYYGKASLVHNVPVTEKTIFRIYSTTKLFVATGVFKLIEENKLSLEDDITKYVAGLPKDWHQVKVKHLLTHSSGLPDMSPFNKFQNLTEEQAKEFVFKDKMKAPIGEEFSYNQTNFWLLQQIIEKVSGQKFTDFIVKHQFGSERAGVLFNADSRDIIPNRSDPYFPFNRRRIQIDTSYSGDYLMSANGLNITLDEFIKWNNKFDNNEFLKKETKASMWNPFKYKKTTRDFAYSWEIYPLKNTRSYGFTGSFVTAFRIFPNEKLSIIILTNGFDRFFQIDDVVDYLAGIVDIDLVNKKVEIAELVTSGLTNGNVTKTIANYNFWKAEVPKANFERLLNTLGYGLVNQGKIVDAIEVFKLNTREYPKSENVWDSLGEAYFLNKQYKLALENYNKSLQLDPISPNAKMMIKKIEDILKN